jgi:putative multiple sugar transport system ATP-binding protein
VSHEGERVILEMRGITKTFPGVKALSNVNLGVRAGEIHAVVGENGAGKSTLMKVLSGVYPCDSYTGAIHFEGEERRFKGIADSEKLGIIIIHQELALVPLLSIAENIFLGNEIARGGVIDWFAAYAKTRELLAKVGLKEPPTTLVTDLGVGKQQLVEIAKALAKEVKLLILDEPTASLNEKDSDSLLELLLALKRQGIASILISHKLNEIAKVADSVTVLRDGATVETIDCRTQPVGEDRIIRGMVGRDMEHRYPQRTPKIGETVLEVRDWRVHHALHADREQIKGVSLHVRQGEIVGIAGLMGAGRTELAMSVFGKSYGQRISGEVLMHGKPVDVGTVRKAIDHGIAYVTEDRKGLGLVLEEDIRKNISLANLDAVAERAVIDTGREFKVANDYRKALNIRCSGVEQLVVNLSGGNQQKVVLSKWLFTKPELLMLDEPTRGIDVGAKYEIYTIIDQLASEGKGILMISSELPELLGMCDRIYVMNEGRFVAEFKAGEATQERIMHAIVSAGSSVHVPA